MKLSTHRRRPDRRAHALDAGGWLPLLPLDLRPGVGRYSVRQSGLAKWLRESASLTARLQRFGVTKVLRVRQTRARPNRDEEWFIGAPGSGHCGRSVMVREVVLTVDGVPWVFAHTLANAPATRLLRRAGRHALAVVLFTDPQVSAGPLQYRHLDVRHPLYRAAQTWCGDLPAGSPSTLMARRALFTRGAARLLVTEVFLPAVAG
jgi:chorismate--pyruvate lyase